MDAKDKPFFLGIAHLIWTAGPLQKDDCHCAVPTPPHYLRWYPCSRKGKHEFLGMMFCTQHYKMLKKLKEEHEETDRKLGVKA